MIDIRSVVNCMCFRALLSIVVSSLLSWRDRDRKKASKYREVKVNTDISFVVHVQSGSVYLVQVTRSSGGNHSQKAPTEIKVYRRDRVMT